MYTYVWMCVYICMCVAMCIYVCVCLCACVWVCICVCLCVCVYMCICMHVYMCVGMHMCVCVCTHRHMQTLHLSRHLITLKSDLHNKNLEIIGGWSDTSVHIPWSEQSLSAGLLL